MHRTIPVPRLIGWYTLFVGLMLLVSARVVSAQDLTQVNLVQEQPKKDETPIVIMMTPGTNQTYTSKEDLKRVENDRPKVLHVSAIKDKPNQVVFEAVGPGRARVKLTDIKDKYEFVDVVVISDRVKELREVVAKLVPSGAVTVNSTNGDNTVVLTGYVLTNADARVVQQAATNLFGANVINNIQIGGVQQVQLEVVVAIVNRTLTRNMSFSWVQNGQNAFAASILGGTGGFANALTPAVAGATSALGGPSGVNLPFGILNNQQAFTGYLNALRQEGVIKVLAEPRVTTLSGRPASFTSGGEVPIVLPGTVGAGPSVTYKPFGTVVNFLPIVLGNGKIHLEVRPELSNINTAISVTLAGTSAPGFDSRNAQVSVQIDDGQTLMIGGLIQNRVNATINRVPILGDLPFIGMAFTGKSYSDIEEEMVILVTPRLVDPVDCTKIPKYLPGRETRVPDDYELFLEGIIEAPRGQRNVIFHPHLYKSAYRHADNINQIPCGNGKCMPSSGCANGSCATPAIPNVNSVPTKQVQADSTTPMVSRLPSEPEAVPMPIGQLPNLVPAVPQPQAIPAAVIPNQLSLTPVSFGQGRP